MSTEGSLGHLLVIKDWIERLPQTFDAFLLFILRLQFGIFVDSRPHDFERLARLSETREAKAQRKNENANLYLPYLSVHQGYPF